MKDHSQSLTKDHRHKNNARAGDLRVVLALYPLSAATGSVQRRSPQSGKVTTTEQLCNAHRICRMSRKCTKCGLKWAFDGGLCRECKASDVPAKVPGAQAPPNFCDPSVQGGRSTPKPAEVVAEPKAAPKAVAEVKEPEAEAEAEVPKEAEVEPEVAAEVEPKEATEAEAEKPKEATEAAAAAEVVPEEAAGAEADTEEAVKEAEAEPTMTAEATEVMPEEADTVVPKEAAKAAEAEAEEPNQEVA